MIRKLLVGTAVVLLAAGVPLLRVGPGGAGPAVASPAAVEVIGRSRADGPDPFVLRDGTTYYAYTTGTADWVAVPVWRSSDLAHWTRIGDAMPAVPPWSQWAFTWAPSVLRTGDRYILYFTGRVLGTDRPAIGAAVSSAPEGPFTPLPAPMVCDPAGSIDPYPFRDSDGSLYLYWKLDGNRVGTLSSLWGARLTSDGLALAGAPVRLIEGGMGWEWPTIENPAMVEVSGRYYLFYSGSWFDSPSYATGYATAAGPLGPCTKQTRAAPWVAAIGDEVGVGGASPFVDRAGRQRLIVHAWAGTARSYGTGGTREFLVVPVRFATEPVLTADPMQGAWRPLETVNRWWS
jgi:beta-xylosidase